MSSSEGLIYNKGSEHVSYFTPEQDPPSGTAETPQPGNSKIPKLFQPLTIRGTTFQNRIWLSPLCQYSSENGKMTAWHMAHLGGIISRGPGLSMIEGTSISPEGRIDPNGVGLWNDEQIQPMKDIVDFAHSQGQKIAIQLFHAGRKASTVAPWLGVHLATKEAGGWPDKVIGPSAEPFDEKHAKPIEMSLKDIEDIKVAWVKSVQRALRAGFDVIEVHAAHGYLLHNFLSPASNKRTDKYGGTLENRLRFVLEIIELTRKAIPDTMPLFLRLSATDWLEHTDIESWTVKDSVQLSLRAAELGVDFIDVSSGGLHPEQVIKTGPGYQAVFSKEIKDAVQDKALVGAVGQIVTGTQANELLEDGLDAIFSGRLFQKNPGLVWQWAEDLGVRIYAAKQIRWGFQGVWRK